MKRRFLLSLILGVLAVLPLSAKDYNVADFGAKPDGVTLNSARIQGPSISPAPTAAAVSSSPRATG